MRTTVVCGVAVWALLLCPLAATGQQPSIEELLDLLDSTGIDLDPGTIPGLDGDVPDTGPVTPPSEQEADIPIPQDNVSPGALRERAPGNMVTQGIINYRARRPNLRKVGPQTGIEAPDVPEKERILPGLIADVTDSLFGVLNQFLTMVNLVTQFGSTGDLSGVDVDSLLQQLLNQKGVATAGGGVNVPEALLPVIARSPSLVLPTAPPAGQ